MQTIVERIRHRVKGIYGGLLLALFKTIPEFYAYDLRNGMYYNNDYTVIQVLTVASKSAELLKNVTIEYKNRKLKNQLPILVLLKLIQKSATYVSIKLCIFISYMKLFYIRRPHSLHAYTYNQKCANHIYNQKKISLK